MFGGGDVCVVSALGVEVGVDGRAWAQRREHGAVLVEGDGGGEGTAPFEVAEPLNGAVGARARAGAVGLGGGWLVGGGAKGMGQRGQRGQLGNVWVLDGFGHLVVCGHCREAVAGGRAVQGQTGDNEEGDDEGGLEPRRWHLQPHGLPEQGALHRHGEGWAWRGGGGGGGRDGHRREPSQQQHTQPSPRGLGLA